MDDETVLDEQVLAMDFERSLASDDQPAVDPDQTAGATWGWSWIV